jgi:hypothetical protein
MIVDPDPEYRIKIKRGGAVQVDRLVWAPSLIGVDLSFMYSVAGSKWLSYMISAITHKH